MRVVWIGEAYAAESVDLLEDRMAWKFNLVCLCLKSGGGLRPAAPLLTCGERARLRAGQMARIARS